jgi:hypothetical protein
MKNVIIRNMYTVGMHHHLGQREMEIGPVFYWSHEPTNPRYANVVAMYSGRELTRRACYVQQSDASRVKDVLKFAHGPCDFRAKSRAEKFHRFKGLMQRCNIAFKCQNKTISKLEQLLKENRIMFTIFWNNVKKG